MYENNYVEKKLPFLSYKQQLYSKKRNLFRKIKVRIVQNNLRVTTNHRDT